MKKKIFLFVLLAAVLGILIGYNSNLSKPTEKIGYALDTQIRIIVYDKNVDKEIVNGAYDEILRLDRLLSNYNKESETARLNRVKNISACDELKTILSEGVAVSGITKGNYDITIFPLVKIWNYKNARVPDPEEIEIAKQKVDYRNIEINGNEITLKNDCEIDVSSIAKGYIADFVIEYLKERNVKSALVDAGGNIKVMGSPGGKNKYFNIGIKDPDLNSGLTLGNIKLNDKSIVTSGIYERNFTYKDKTYHHIIDAKTGYPSESDVVSVSVISRSSMLADAYATGIVVMGANEGLNLIENTPDTECIIVTKDKKIIISSGVKDFEITNGNYRF